jgi:hypothetical protein
MNILTSRWWPFGLLAAGALMLWGLGYRPSDTGAIGFMALLIMGAGGYLVMVERSRRG